MIVTLHALTVHTLGGELSYGEIILIEVLWIPILLFSRTECKRSLYVLFGAFSGYFLPRLLNIVPWSYLQPLLTPDLIVNNLVFKLFGLQARMVYTRHGPFIEVNGIGIVGYLIGCSSLRAIPMIVGMIIPLSQPLYRRLVAISISSLLVYPFNAIRVALIIEVSKLFSINLEVAHVLLSPLISIVTVSIILWIADFILKGELIERMERGLECLFDCIKPTKTKP